MTYTLQELEALCAAATQGPWAYEQDNGDSYVKSAGDGHVVAEIEESKLRTERSLDDATFICAARTAIPELIARIKELDPDYNASPAQDAVGRVEALSAEAAAKRAKLDKALADAGMGDKAGMDELGLEAFLDDEGLVKIRQKPRKSSAP